MPGGSSSRVKNSRCSSDSFKSLDRANLRGIINFLMSKFNQGASAPYRFSADRVNVTQICNLLYRRFVICKGPEVSRALIPPQALPNAIRRYSRLQICDTLN